jgi:phage shock protein PspC (stress-responsive transcriptional regulator)
MNTTTASPQDSKSTDDGARDSFYDAPLLERPIHDRMLAGVALGAARYLRVDPTVVRILFAVLVVVGGIGVPLYVAGWLLIPEEGRDQSIASEFIQSHQTRSR